MDIQLLLDGIVRQTTVLIAELATAGGARAPLAHVANQVFLDLASELERQGVGRKVSADMFGIALRSYQRKIARLRESSTEHGRTLWTAVYDFLQERGVASRSDVYQRFSKDETDLRARIDAYNATHGIPPRHWKVVSYAGQSVVVEPGTDAAESRQG